jgi:hypothetical protein
VPPIKGDYYHVWDHAGAAWTTKDITVPKISGVGTEVKKFYSLKKDMDALRTLGASAAKGAIVDAAVVSLPIKSHNLGRELWALKVGKGAANKILFTGCHHSREWISIEIPFLVAHYLIENYTPTLTATSTDKERRIHHLLQNNEIWFVPMVNPDGHEHTLTTDRNWRANRNSYVLAATTIAAAGYKGAAGRSIPVAAGTYTGVDVNRNYATTTWGQETFNGAFPATSRDPADGGANSVWCGPSAASEKETQAISALNNTAGFKCNISYHNYGQLMLWPDPAKDASDTFVQDVGNGMTEVINAHGGGKTYTFGTPSALLYAATGSQMDHFWEVRRRPSYTPEVRPLRAESAKGFSALPEAEIKPCFEENLGAALALINCGGHATAATTTTTSWSLRWPPMTVVVVPNCWNVFKGWVP